MGDVDLIPLAPTAMVAGGDALARDADGRVVFVTGALPGEEVVARLTAARRDYRRAVAVDVRAPSPDRVAPPCPALAAGCGGCTWQHVAPVAQGRLKAAIVVDALRRIGRLTDPPEPRLVDLPEPALRTTARLAVSPAGRAGHRPRAGGGSPVETDTCLAVHPRLEEVLVHGRFPAAREVVLRVGVASGERVAVVDGPAAKATVPKGVTVVGWRDRRPAYVHEEVAGRRFRVSARAFFQPGPVAAAGLVAAVTEAVGDTLGPSAHLVDAYAGTGLFGATLGAATGARITAIEQDPEAVADAMVNLAGLDARVLAMEVGRWDPTRSGPVDVVVADPARPGLGRPGVTALAATGAPVLVLVSCDPASLARDAALLGAAGYRLGSVTLVDAFPHTFHVETVGRFDLG